MAVPQAARRFIDVAKGEVGYRERPVNRQKYSKSTPGLEWSDGQPWCATFVSWCALQAGVGHLLPRTASTDAGAKWFRDRGRFSQSPSIGAQVFYGKNGDMNHTGIVYDFTSSHIWTIEGNTNGDGVRDGDGVWLKKRARNSYIQGFGHPAWPADPVKGPTPVTRARTLLNKSVELARKAGNEKRVAALKKALERLPKR